MTLQTIMVEAKSKFGVLDGTTNKWLNPKDKDLLAQFNVGHSYNVGIEDSVGKNGKSYTNIVSIAGDRGPTADVPKDMTNPFVKLAAEANEKSMPPKLPYKAPFKKAWTGGKKTDAPATDWLAKDRSQLVGGRSHDAAAMAVAKYNTSGGDILAIYKELLIGIVKIADEVK